MTAKPQKKRPSSRSDRPKRFKGLMKKVKRLQKIRKASIDAENKRCADEEAQFGKIPERVVSDTPFQEKHFGYPVAPGRHICVADQNSPRDLSSIVVSLALYDGDEMLFACSGIPIPSGTATKLDVTRFVTSECLVREFNSKRNRDDELRVEVHLPDGTITDGFLGLYDDDIAIVTSLGPLDVCSIDLDYKPKPASFDDRVIAAGRAFSSGSLMAISGVPRRECSTIWVPHGSDATKAILGGPLIGNEIGDVPRFLGMNLAFNQDLGYTFLPLGLLRERLEHFQILNPKVIHFRDYSLPEGVKSIIPSGFMRDIYRLKSLGYPLPPPLVLEFNGKLLNDFEDYFGELLNAWNPPRNKYTGRVWSRFPREVLTKISRRVVSLASFNEGIRFFACTGLLIKLCQRTVILTSASLVTNNDGEGSSVHNLKIEVFLPPNQRRSGILVAYSLNYNIAIVTVEKSFHCACPEDIFKTNLNSSEVVAVGRDADEGLLMGSIGKVADEGLLMGSIGKVKPTNKDCEVNCKELRVSTCEISKAGIGGPLIDLGGSFVGMNFYDGRRMTPFLPKSKIVELLNEVISEWGSERKFIGPRLIDDGLPTRAYRWPVPQPYWFHGELDVDRYDIPKLMGRRLDVGVSIGPC